MIDNSSKKKLYDAINEKIKAGDKFSNLAHIDYLVGGIKGGQPHRKNNVGNVTTITDGDLTIECDAFTDTMGERNRRNKSLITIKKANEILFCGSPAMLENLLREYSAGDPEHKKP